MRFPWFVGLLAFSLVAAGSSQESKGKSDQEQIQGTWKVVEAEQDGMKPPQQFLDNFKVTFKGDKAVPEGVQGSEATFKLDSDKKPRQIQITPNEGGGSRVMKGIYQIDGDTLKLCFRRGENAEPPTEFSGAAGTGNMLMVLKRQK